jgi:hypothetical protein
LTANDYADLKVLEVPALPQLDLVATPVGGARAPELAVGQTSYSSSWRGPNGSTHVVVDGLLNGWLVRDSRAVVVSYSGDEIVRASFAVSVLGVIAIALLSISLSGKDRIRWQIQPLIKRLRLGRYT